MATISPRAMPRQRAGHEVDRRRSARPRASSSCRRGPHAGQAFGSAWKRRSSGDRYSRQAGRALREARHAGRRAVVGQGARDRVARPAVGAVREGVAPAAVGAGRSISPGSRRRSRCRGRSRWRAAAAALDDREAAPDRAAGVAPGSHVVDARQRRRLGAQAAQEGVERLGSPSTSIVTPAASLRTQPARPSSLRQPVDEGPEAHALHDAAHGDAASLAAFGARLRLSMAASLQACRQAPRRRLASSSATRRRSASTLASRRARAAATPRSSHASQAVEAFAGGGRDAHHLDAGPHAARVADRRCRRRSPRRAADRPC